MSTNSAVAWTTFRDRLISARRSSRSSGTLAVPMFVSVVENGWAATGASAPVSALNSDVFPAFGNPTNPNRSIGRSRLPMA